MFHYWSMGSSLHLQPPLVPYIDRIEWEEEALGGRFALPSSSLLSGSQFPEYEAGCRASIRALHVRSSRRKTYMNFLYICWEDWTLFFDGHFCLYQCSVTYIRFTQTAPPFASVYISSYLCAFSSPTLFKYFNCFVNNDKSLLFVYVYSVFSIPDHVFLQMQNTSGVFH